MTTSDEGKWLYDCLCGLTADGEKSSLVCRSNPYWRNMIFSWLLMRYCLTLDILLLKLFLCTVTCFLPTYVYWWLCLGVQVVCAFGRLGTMFGCEKYNIKPDLVSIAKVSFLAPGRVIFLVSFCLLVTYFGRKRHTLCFSFVDIGVLCFSFVVCTSTGL
jgi:hypothetical protein